MHGHLGAAGLVRLLGPWRRPGAVAYTTLADQLRQLVLDGRVPLRTRLPSERELAESLGVSRRTVGAAYERLRAGRYLDSRQGSGSWTTLPDTAATAHLESSAAPFAPHGHPAALDLAHAALPAPAGELLAAAARALEALPRYLTGHGYQLSGLDPLRDAVAARLTSRGLPTSREQVLVTAGAQQAIALTLRSLVSPGDRVLVEHPTYPNALEAVRRAHARAVPVALGPDGWDVDALAATLRDAAPRLAYLIADFHNPTGLCMGPDQRVAVIELVRRTRTPLIVDETMSELWLDQPPPGPLAALAGETLPVITVGSASKTFWGGLRVGWLRAPRPLVRQIAVARASLDLASPVLEQLVATELLSRADQVLAQRRPSVRTARDALLGLLAANLPAWKPNSPSGGLSLWVDLGVPVSSALTARASDHGVLLAAGPRFGLDGAFERRMRLPYTLPLERLEDAVHRLVAAWVGLSETALTEVASQVV